MPHSSHHPDNPCSLKLKSDHLPAKIWELLRKNQKFVRTVNRLAMLQDRLKKPVEKPVRKNSKRPPSPGRKILSGIEVGSYDWSSTHQTIQQLRAAVSAKNKYGDMALQWLVPTPTFQKRKSYRHRRGRFTCNTPWRNTPKGFKQDFRALCGDLDDKDKVSLRKDRPASPKAHEVTFLSKESQTSLFKAIATRGALTKEDFMHAIRLDDLARNYRVFAVPRLILNRGEVTDIVGLIKRKLKVSRRKQPKLLGSEIEWNDWLSEWTWAPESPDGDYYHRRKYLTNLSRQIFPILVRTDLLASTPHRSKRKRSSKRAGN